MDACRSGKIRFTKDRWFATRVLNHPVSLRDIFNGHNSGGDIAWLVGKMYLRITLEDMKRIATSIKDLLIKHNKWDVEETNPYEDNDIVRLVQITRNLLDNSSLTRFDRQQLIYVPLCYDLGYYGYNNDALHKDIKDALLDFEGTVDWCNGYKF